mgnify:CR=1 FL=1
MREDAGQLLVEVDVESEDGYDGSLRGLGPVALGHVGEEAGLGLGGADDDDPQRLGVHRRGRPLHELEDRVDLLVGDGLVRERVGRAGLAEEQALRVLVEEDRVLGGRVSGCSHG